MTELPHALDKLMNERLLFAITARKPTGRFPPEIGQLGPCPIK